MPLDLPLISPLIPYVLLVISRVCNPWQVWGEMPLDAETAPFTSLLALIESTGGPTAGPTGGPTVAGLRERLIVLSSPSKTFNIAALDVAFAIVPDPDLLRRFIAGGRDAAEVPPFGHAAALAAYADPECEAWRLRLIDYLRANREYAAASLESHLRTIASNHNRLCQPRVRGRLPMCL